MASGKIVRDEFQRQSFEKHKETFPDLPVPLWYGTADTGGQNIDVGIPGSLETMKHNLVLNVGVMVDINTVKDALNMDISPWKLGYEMTIRSSQGLTVNDKLVWIVDDRMQGSNLVNLAVSRVRKITHLRPIVVCLTDSTDEVMRTTQ